ncbi:SDR family oxidoreductase [Gryllotalpicola protaetiae]|uniref:SDR family NAD(P)-dependent oxidoreductase n=1 Tax=Gryllotalpicola protaetiae TaxID=2419771 RepID=A0A387BGL5_9MICO|nr:SDR family oxidoreductase [Gryllotalpicola protaetiae]AYG03155.1 SDR family NAD(P)-dependent oxidoreductase [Gryllotalpicola protaetiae]
MGLCDGRVAVVTGAGRGIGREHALALARAGARVVVNDIGAAVDGSGGSGGPAAQVVAEIEAAGGRAVANTDDISDFEAAGRVIQSALDAFERLDVVVNNAGILRDRMLVNMTPEEWDAVIRVHLRGTFAMAQQAAAHWRSQSKAGHEVDARIINTTSNSGLFGNPGQANYGAAKAGIAGFTVIAALELERYGVTVNAISPGADTRMTVGVLPEGAPGADGFDPRDPANISPLVVWLASPRSRAVTGQVFLVRGSSVAIAERWRKGAEVVTDGRWDPAALGELVPDLIASTTSVTSALS